MATFCDNCGGVPEFHIAGRCWCEDYCDCKGYIEGGTTIPETWVDPQRDWMVARCRHCQAPMGKSASWFAENYCGECNWARGDITTMLPGETVTVNYSGQPFGGFCQSQKCEVCEPYYSEEAIYHVCYTDGGCLNCERGIPRRLPMPEYMSRWKCQNCGHSREGHIGAGYCWTCRKQHRKRCHNFIMKQPKPVTKRIMNKLNKRIAAARKMIVTVIRPALPEIGENNGRGEAPSVV